MTSSSSSRQTIEVITTEEAPLKWSVPLSEEVFRRRMILLGQGNKVFGEGSIFSPLLFGKFFDPSDAFPLWEFESDALLAALRSSGKSNVDWYQSDEAYVLRAQLPAAAAGGGGGGSGKKLRVRVRVCVEKEGKVVEISGQWKHHDDDDEYNDHPKPWDWRSGHWWEYGYVRRLELPEDADCRQVEANLMISCCCNGTTASNETALLLELKIPKQR